MLNSLDPMWQKWQAELIFLACWRSSRLQSLEKSFLGLSSHVTTANILFYRKTSAERKLSKQTVGTMLMSTRLTVCSRLGVANEHDSETEDIFCGFCHIKFCACLSSCAAFSCCDYRRHHVIFSSSSHFHTNISSSNVTHPGFQGRHWTVQLRLYLTCRNPFGREIATSVSRFSCCDLLNSFV